MLDVPFFALIFFKKNKIFGVSILVKSNMVINFGVDFLHDLKLWGIILKMSNMFSFT